MENAGLATLAFVIAFLVLLFAGWEIAFALGAVSILGYFFFGGGTVGNFSYVASNTLFSYYLLALPVFILMGEVVIMSGIVGRLYDSIIPLLPPIPGGLVHVNVLANVILGACVGSTIAATSATTAVALPELKKRGYTLGPAYGSLASAGCIAGLIPPSVGFILYSSITSVSMGQLFIAGIIPGLLLGLAISVVIVAIAIIRPWYFPHHQKEKGITLGKSIFFALKNLWPVAILIIFVLGSIYAGICTATESGCIGVVGALLLAIGWRRFSFEKLKKALFDTVQISGSLLVIIAVAGVYGFALNYVGLKGIVGGILTALPGGPIAKMLFIFLFFIILGMFLDGGSMVIITTPIFLPFVVSLGFSEVWYGIWLIVAVEMGNITPPVGLTLFAVQAVSGDRLETITRASLPFWASFIIVVLLITFWPDLVLWLPHLAFGYK